MTPEEWLRVQDLFARALELDTSARDVFLAGECASDAELQREVDSLLAAHEKTGGFPSRVADWNPTLLPEGLGEGTVVDEKYEVHALLGRGGMGAVYRATDLRLERPVALKLIRSDMLGDPLMAERFRREAVAVARLRHPNIVTIHDYGVAEGVGVYLVMEYLEGRSLRAELASRLRFEVGEALEIIGQVCAAVGEAHRSGIIHRDLKPDNVFVERGPHGTTVKVLDFGLAKLADEALSRRGALTRSGTVLGTPAYMAPEQCRGEEADARSDVYALGCVLYEMLTGRPPFVAPTVISLIHKHVHELPVRPGDLAPGIDLSVEKAILRALAKNAEKRHQTAEAFARAIGAHANAIAPDTLSPVGVTMGGGGVVTGAVEAGRPVQRAAPTNLRHGVTRFVGRQGELVEVQKWLARTRLVTLVGPGGIGKTRLALETAALTLGEYRDGVWLVELAALADESLVDRRVAAALDVREHPERPLAESLAEWLRGKQLLLVLDNCEHLVEACARLAERLLEAAPELRVLATSREVLGIPGEAAWPVPPLGVGARGEESDAATLFADRAALARPGFEITGTNVVLVAELCGRLEGIPLAIELAAARVKVLTVEQILERLDDRFRLLAGGSRTAPTRQQTLHATLDWSYELLTKEERALLRRLSVFAGGWTLEAAEAAAGNDERSPIGDVHRLDVVDVLSRLVDKSLVTVHDEKRKARYGMLEMIRAYGLEHLSRSGEAHDVRRRHAEYFLAEAEVVRRELRNRNCAEWLELLEEEHDNVRAALGWLVEYDPVRCLRLATAVSQFRVLHGHVAEARRWLDTALARAHAAPGHLRADALLEAGSVAATQGDLQAARAFFEQGIPIARESGSELVTVMLVYSLGDVALLEGDLQAARTCFGETLANARERGNVLLVASSLNSLGEAARLEGAWDAAKGFYEQAVALGRQFGNEPFLSTALCNLGAVECELGELHVAKGHYGEVLTMAQALRSIEHIGLSLDGLGAIAAKRGAWVRAARLAGAAEVLLDVIGAKLAPLDRTFRERYLVEVREHLGEAEFEAAVAEGQAMTIEQAVALAITEPEAL